MKSIRSRTLLLTISTIVVTMAVATVLGVALIMRIGNASAGQTLTLLCEVGEKSMDSYFGSVEQSVGLVSSFASADLDTLAATNMQALAHHVDRVRDIFEKTAERTNGVLTYYYRIDPAFSASEKGFWYTALGEEGFTEHEVTDISRYDTTDTSQLVWFTVPKATGEPIWLPPYVTDNLDVRVISYNVPVYWEERFVGVVGIELDYAMLAEQADRIRLYDSGYAYVSDAEGNLIYHPMIDVTAMDEADRPKAPDALKGDARSVRYRFDGVEKQAAWMELENGMRLIVVAPVSEINSGWQRLVIMYAAVSILLLIVFSANTLRMTGVITEPLRELTEVAKRVDEGDYDVELTYRGTDEVGVLTHTFDQLVRHLKVYISDLNSLAYADALTSVRNKGAYEIHIRELQTRLEDPEAHVEFAAGVFDCDNLKAVNDQYGHDKGDIYVKTACRLICSVFKHSAVFRTGGDEFTAILQGEDYLNREELTRRFAEESAAICESAGNLWEQVRVSMGVTAYDPQEDVSAIDVVRRADKLMYEDKRSRKVARGM